MAYAPNYFETPEQRAQRMRNAALGGQDLFDVEGPMPGDWREQFGSALPPPFMETKQEVASRLAGQRTDKWRRRLYGLAAGLQAARGASNFGEGLLGGLSGSLMGGEQFQRHQAEQEQVRLQGEQQKADREYRMLQDAINNRQQDERIGMERKRLYAEKPQALTEMGLFLSDPNKFKAYMDAKDRSEPGRKYRSEFEFYLDDPEGYKAWRAARGQGDEPEDLGYTTEYFDAEGNPTDYYGAVRTQRTKLRSNTPGISYDRRTRTLVPPSDNPLSKYAR